ncbi:hypothetical protein [Psychromonas marina]|uniref:hypothetical protein n=1 Tax=Psychromonas marina TaxID=88364 RepID=UPI0024E08164|nr:hypothetical protein [Psychromonas marina]
MDKEFISELYEESTGNSPSVNITKSEGGNAGVKALFMSASVTSTESKNYQISTSKMVKDLKEELVKYNHLDFLINTELGYNSQYFWVTGKMTVEKTTRSTQTENVTIGTSGVKTDKVGEPKIKGEEQYFCIRDINGNSFPLIASEEYFSSNVSQIIGLAGVVVEAVNFEVKALLRILPARTSFKGGVAIPLIIEEATT